MQMSKENKLLDNKQLIHIATEVVVILGITYYFSSKTKKLMSHIEDLTQRLEEQEERLQKLQETTQQTFQQMATSFRNVVGQVNDMQLHVQQQTPVLQKRYRHERKKSVLKQKKPDSEIVSNPVVPKSDNNSVRFNVNDNKKENDRVIKESDRLVNEDDDNDNIDNVEENDSDMEQELQEELSELEDFNLKKTNN